MLRTAALTALSLCAFSPLAAADPTPPLAVECAVHAGRRDGDSIVWDSVFRVSPKNACGRLTLARPLSTDATIAGADGAALTAQHDARGRIVSVDLCAVEGLARLSFTQPVALGAAHFSPAFAAGMAVQALTLDGEEGLRFDPSSRTEVEIHRMWMGSAGVDEAELAHCAQRMPWARPSVLRPPIYVRATSPTLDANGLAGELTSAGLRRERTFRRVSALTVVVLALGLLLRRRLASLVESELVDSLIRSHRRDPA